VRLAAERTVAPGRVLTSSQLVSSGWPGERLIPSAVRNRLKVLIGKMRALGLGSILLTRGDGYYLDPRVPIRIADDGERPADAPSA
jgi:hypothetical protein